MVREKAGTELSAGSASSSADASEAQVVPNFIPKRRFQAYFLGGRGIGLTPTCSSAVYGAP